VYRHPRARSAAILLRCKTPISSLQCNGECKEKL